MLKFSLIFLFVIPILRVNSSDAEDAIRECGNLHRTDMNSIADARAEYSNNKCLLTCYSGIKVLSTNPMSEGYVCDPASQRKCHNGHCANDLTSEAVHECSNLHKLELTQFQTTGTEFTPEKCTLKCVIDGKVASVNPVNEGYACEGAQNGICRKGSCVMDSTTQSLPSSTTVVTTIPTTIPPPTLSPTKTLDCDFEQNTACNWRFGANVLQIGTPRTANVDQIYLPAVDHTRQTVDGHFLYHYNKENLESTGMFLADNPLPNREICISFFYYLYASVRSSFTVTLDSHTRGKSVVVFRGYGSNEINWRKAYFTVNQNETFELITFRSRVSRGIFAIDDIKLTDHHCPLIKTESFEHCDFEDSTNCGFKPAIDAYVDWTLFQAASFSSDHYIDHTTHTSEGHFYGIDMAKLNKSIKMNNFEIESKALDKIRCIRFSYMIDKEMTLYYGIKYQNQITYNSVENWHIIGSTSGMWFTHQAIVTASASNYTVSIVIGVKNTSDTGKLFIDDIVLDSSLCSVERCDFEDGNMCTLEPVLPSSRIMEPARKLYLAYASVQTAITVNYLNDFVDQTWHIFSPRNPKASKYVQWDNTYKSKTGKYMLLIGEHNDDRGIVYTERYSLDGRTNICFSLAVYKPDELAILEMYQVESMQHLQGVKLWELKRSTNNEWEMFHIKATPQHSHSTDMYFSIIGTIFSPESYIAIDDISTHGDCLHPSNVLSSTPTKLP